MKKLIGIIFILGMAGGVAAWAEPQPTTIGCVDVTHNFHGLWFYSLQVQRVGTNEEGPVDQVLLTRPDNDSIAGGQTAAVFKNVEEIREASSLLLVGRAFRLEISDKTYYEDMYLAKVTLKAGPYDFQNVTFACHVHQ